MLFILFSNCLFIPDFHCTRVSIGCVLGWALQFRLVSSVSQKCPINAVLCYFLCPFHMSRWEERLGWMFGSTCYVLIVVCFMLSERINRARLQTQSRCLEGPSATTHRIKKLQCRSAPVTPITLC